MLILILIFEILALVGLFILVAIIRNYLPSYLGEKGKNLATKEDIAGITNEIEKVRHEYASKLESLSFQNAALLAQGERQHQLRLAALDQKLEAHQQAYTLWIKLMRSVYDKNKVAEIANECDEWWINRGLYLEPEARKSFRVAYLTAPHHDGLVKSRTASSALVEDSWKKIEAVGEVIVKAIALPPISGAEEELNGRAPARPDV